MTIHNCEMQQTVLPQLSAVAFGIIVHCARYPTVLYTFISYQRRSGLVGDTSSGILKVVREKKRNLSSPRLMMMFEFSCLCWAIESKITHHHTVQMRFHTKNASRIHHPPSSFSFHPTLLLYVHLLYPSKPYQDLERSQITQIPRHATKVILLNLSPSGFGAVTYFELYMAGDGLTDGISPVGMCLIGRVLDRPIHCRSLDDVQQKDELKRVSWSSCRNVGSFLMTGIVADLVKSPSCRTEEGWEHSRHSFSPNFIEKKRVDQIIITREMNPEEDRV